jgi:hypothetical protein
LAIAGLIMLIVFMAVPALQRSSRNNQRRSDASHLIGLINEYSSNHNGQMPKCFSAVAPCVDAASGLLDLASENFSALSKPTGAIIALPATVPAIPALDTPAVYSSATCSNNTPAPGGGARSIIVRFSVEPNTQDQCIGQ